MTKITQILPTLCLAGLLFSLSGCQSTLNTSANNLPTQENFLIGTYTQKGSQGVYKVTLDPKANKLTNQGLIAEGENPSYLAISGSQDWLYAATGKQSGSINTYKINNQTQKYAVTQQVTGLGKGTCHISLNPQETKLAVANYSSSDVYMFDIDPTTKKLTQAGYFKNEGSGPTSRQEKSHMHYVHWDKSGKFLYAVDLGTDEVLAFEASNHHFSPIVAAKLTAGDGPRHLAFHPNKPWVYVLNELSNSLAVFEQDTSTGKLTLKQHLSALTTPTKNNTSSAIKISKDGKFVYAGVRGINEIAVFKILEDGTAELIHSHPTLGNWPRDINLSENQQYLLIANQKSDTVTVLKRDSETGLLSNTEMSLTISTPSYIGNYR